MAYTKILFFAALMFAPRFFEPDACENFTVDNESSYTIGTVAVTGYGSPVPIDVTGSGDFSDTVCFTPLGVVINGQNALYPDTTTVTLADESIVKVEWQSTQLIFITNQAFRRWAEIINKKSCIHNTARREAECLTIKNKTFG